MDILKPIDSSNRKVLNFFYIFLGVISASIGLKGFLLPNGFFDGGAMGISLLLNHFVQTDLAFYIVLINIPFVIIGYHLISREFAIKSTIAIISLAIMVYWIHVPILTSDKLLISIFGGVFLGTGIGLSMRGGAVIDGTEVLAVQVSRKTSLSVGDFIALFNIFLFIVVAAVINVETAMYSMLTYVSASKSVDFVISGIEEYIGVTIVSAHYDLIRDFIINELKRGVTVYKTEGGFGKTGETTEERKALFCVVTRLEVGKLVSDIQKLDSEAFVIQQSVKDTHGGMIKRRPLH